MTTLQRSIPLLVAALFAGSALAEPMSLFPKPKAPPSAASAADHAYQAGIAALAAGDQAAAARAFREAVAKQPDHAHALLGLGQIAFARKRLDEADRLIRQAAQVAPNDAHVQASLGRLLVLQQRIPEAEAALRKAIALDSKLLRARMDLADLIAGVPGKERHAVQQYQAVLQLDANHAGAHYALGVTLTRLREFREARAALETSARLEPKNPLPPLALARLSLEQQDLESALKGVERALEIQPALTAALELRGDVQQMRRADDRALADYAAAVRSNPAQVSALLKQAMLHQRLGQRPEAAKVYLAALKIDPKLAVAYNNLAWMATETGEFLDQAEKWSRQAIALAPDVPDFHDTLGWVRRAHGQYADAERVLRHATNLKGASASTHYHLGVVQSEQGKSEAAVAAFKRALVLDPKHREGAEALRKLQGR